MFLVITDVYNAECQAATFGIGPSTTTTRSWDIKITQYACGDEDNGGKYKKKTVLKICLISLP